MDLRWWIAGLLAAGAAPGLSAQTYNDLTLVRGRPTPFTTFLQVRLGALADLPVTTDDAVGRMPKVGVDGHVYFHKEKFTDREATVDVYAGRDGAYLGVTEGATSGQGNQSRLEVTWRYFPFYREGFYNQGTFVPTGRYEGNDYGVALNFARLASGGMRFEGGAFYRRRNFSRNIETASNYVIPDNYNAYGIRTYVEQCTLTLNRDTGRNQAGYLATIAIEREQNDSSATFGVAGIYQSSLPSGVWRGLGHLEWYAPSSESFVWRLGLDAQFTDQNDRVYNYDAQKPQGYLWVDGTLGFRLDVGKSFWFRPYGRGQFINILGQNGIAHDKEWFYGGGIDLGFDIGDSFSLLGQYSFLTNQSRPPVSAQKDTYGEHRFFAGFEIRFGAVRR